MNLSRKSLIGTFALAATLAAPLAFAQSDTSAQSTDTATQSATDASAQSTTTTDATQSTQTGSEQETTTTNEAATSNDASAATTAGDPAKKSWSDVDLDKDGNLSKAEASSVAALGQVFDQADSDANGSLTPDEYKAYLAKSQGEQQQDQQ